MSVDLEVAFEMRGDDDGFCVGELNGEMVASLISIQVADDLSYVSHVYVVEQCRKRGFARRMFAVIHDIMDRCSWMGIAGFNAVSHAQSMYQKFGYKPAYNMIFYQGTALANVDRDFGTDIRLVKDCQFGPIIVIM